MCFRVAVLCLSCLYAMNVQRPLVSQSHPTSFVRSDLRRTRECFNISHCTSLTSLSTFYLQPMVLIHTGTTSGNATLPHLLC